MKLKLYVMDIRELENENLRIQALRLLDPARKEKVLSAKKEKDRARLAGAGLLLLLAHEGLPGSMELSNKTVCPERGRSKDGQGRAAKEPEKGGFLSNECLQILSPDLIIQTIICEEEKKGHPLSKGILYEMTDRGKPSWSFDTGQEEPAQTGSAKAAQNSVKREWAAYPYFNLSHSGHYAALAAGDVPVGIDIQEPREVHHKSIGDYRKFSRMESYFKCTGRGIDSKIEACYREMEETEESGRYFFCSVPMPQEYALWVCADTAPSGDANPEEHFQQRKTTKGISEGSIQ